MMNCSGGDLLVTILDFRADKPVVDKTGLTGRYDFTLRYTMDESRVSADVQCSAGVVLPRWRSSWG